jgi:hypothetical protein
MIVRWRRLALSRIAAPAIAAMMLVCSAPAVAQEHAAPEGMKCAHALSTRRGHRVLFGFLGSRRESGELLALGRHFFKATQFFLLLSSHHSVAVCCSRCQASHLPW